MRSKGIDSRWQREYTNTLRDLVEKGVPSGRSEDALLEIARLSLQIARDAFKRMEGRRAPVG